MAKFSYCIFTVAVLFGGIASDMMCALEEMINFTPDNFITDPDKACRNLDTKFGPSRQALKTCLGIDVDMNKLENLHREFCNPNSDYRQKVDRQRFCLSRNLHKSLNCLLNVGNYRSPQHGNTPTRSLYDTCKNLSVEISKCGVDEVGGPCGAEGQEVSRRMGEAMESFFTALCFSVAKLAAGDDLVDEIEEAEHKVVEDEHKVVEDEHKVVEASHSDQYEDSAATSHSALIWCILVGLLLAARWW